MRYLLILLICPLLLACDGNDGPAGTLQLEQLRGRWVVINYWAQWCKPCIAEIPELNQLNSDHEQVTVLGVNYDGAEGAELAEQLTTLGVDFPTLTVDPAPQLGVPRPQVLPTTFILDPQGKLVQTLLGPQTLETLREATGQASTTEHEG